MGFHIPPIMQRANPLEHRRKLTPAQPVMPLENPDPLMNIGRIPEYIYAPIDILDEDHQLLCSCRVVSYKNGNLQLDRIPGAMSLPVLPENMKVYASTYTKSLTSVFLKAKVRESTRVWLILKDIENKSKKNERQSFRQPMDVPAEIYLTAGHRNPQAIECTLKNISEGGACVTTDHEFNIDDSFTLRTELYPKSGHISFQSQVIRKIPKEHEGFEYGLIFAQITQQKKNYLLADLEAVREQVKKATYR